MTNAIKTWNAPKLQRLVARSAESGAGKKTDATKLKS